VILQVLPRRPVGQVPDVDPPALAAAPPTAAAALALAAALPGGHPARLLDLLVLAVLAHEDRPAVYHAVGQHLDGLGGLPDGLELHDAAALRAAGRLLHDAGVHHLPDLLEVILQVLPRRPVREVPDVAPPALDGRAAGGEGPVEATGSARTLRVPGTAREAAACAFAAAALCAAGPRLQVTVLAVLAHRERPPAELLVIQHLDGQRGLLRRLVLDDAAALGAARVLVLQDLGVDHVARLSEVVLQLLPRCPEGEVTDIAALGHGDASAPWMRALPFASGTRGPFVNDAGPPDQFVKRHLQLRLGGGVCHCCLRQQ